MDFWRQDQRHRMWIREYRAYLAHLLWGLLCLIGVLTTASQSTRLDAQIVDPRLFGFDIPMGNLRHPSPHTHVMTFDQDREPIVAELYVGVGDYCIVRLPNGHLEARRSREAPQTERPFQPLGGEALKQIYRQKFPEYQIRRTPHHLFVYNTSEPFADTAARILETMYGGVIQYMQSRGVPTRHADTPLVVVMFSSDQEFQEFSEFQRLPPDVVAFYDPRTNHVVLREPQVARGAPAELEISQALATIAHEGAHQVLANIGVHQRLAVWPMWLAEGLAEYLAPTKVDQRMRWAGPGQVNQWRMFELEQYFQGRGRDALPGEMLEQTVSAARLTSTGYATAWGLTHYLEKSERPTWSAYLRKCSEIRPLEGAMQLDPPGIVNQNLLDFREAFGEDLGEKEKKLVRYLKGLRYVAPFAERPHILAGVSIPMGRKTNRWASVFLSQEWAERWQEDTIRDLPEEKRKAAQLFLLSYPSRSVAEVHRIQFLRMP